jgi:catechol 2,3-dioxygenase-like lactoylglutathione lyase family enzyme
MEPRIDLVTILTDDVEGMVAFYRDVLGFPVKNQLDNYCEFGGGGVRFAICHRSELARATGHPAYEEDGGTRHAFELAFPCNSPADVDSEFQRIVQQGATPIKEPADMPWGQRTAFFADPDGNIHEIFADPD